MHQSLPCPLPEQQNKKQKKLNSPEMPGIQPFTFCFACPWCYSGLIALPETSIAPENWPSQKETSIPTIFPPSIFRGYVRCWYRPVAPVYLNKKQSFLTEKQMPCSKCYGTDCFGTYFTHVQTRNVTRVQSATEWTASVHTFTQVQTCNVTGVQSATEWTASVHTLHMSKPVM